MHICKYWVGEITSSSDQNMTTIVVKTSMPIKRSDLKKLYTNASIGLKNKLKDDSSLIYIYIIFQNTLDNSLFCDIDLQKSCILKDILIIYNKKKHDLNSKFREQCKI